MSPTRPNSDQAWMARALDLARQVQGHVWPNPPVGCVIVKDQEVVAEAATHPGGRPHAERKALDLAGPLAQGATVYVTLEPCCHWGKTPPCADAIIAAGVSRVVCAVQDPDPRVNGGGFAKLQDAGIDVLVGVRSDEAQAVMSGFLHRVRFGSPDVLPASAPGGAIPDGVDAVLVTGKDKVVVKTRSGLIEGRIRDQDQLLGWKGGLGLTTVAISQEDRFWTKEQTSQAASKRPAMAARS